MRKKKIAICAAQVPFVRGGAELLVEELQKNLILRGYDTEIIQLPYKWYPREQILNSTLAWRFLDLNESNGQKIDLVIPTKFPSYTINHPNKVVWLIHQFRQIYDQYGTQYSDFKIDDYFDNSIRNQVIEIDNKVLKESRKIFTIANNTTNRLHKYNALEAETLYHPPKHVGKYYSDRYENYILSVGRLESVKRVDLLIKALKYCDKNITAVIGGKGPYEEELKKLAKKEGVADRVKFLGFIEDNHMLELYANAMGVFFAPFDEDYGYITLEAFLSKKPVITTVDAGGPLEFVTDNESGFICNVSEQQIGEKIQYLYSHKEICKELGTMGYNTVKDITWDNVIDRLTETIR
ncbi:MAG: glycosyltransferase family 4 protein [Cellulosilyticaceae bacterium]